MMCKYNLNNKSDVKKWLLKNHPDKGGKINSNDFNKILECYQNNYFCNNEPNKTINKKKRIKGY